MQPHRKPQQNQGAAVDRSLPRREASRRIRFNVDFSGQPPRVRLPKKRLRADRPREESRSQRMTAKVPEWVEVGLQK